jgi:hypothetical protein
MNFLAACRPIEKRPAEGEYNPAIGGLGESSYLNALGRMSMQRPSAAQLERASIVYIKD